MTGVAEPPHRGGQPPHFAWGWFVGHGVVWPPPGKVGWLAPMGWFGHPCHFFFF
jgi:hypothetical protein